MRGVAVLIALSACVAFADEAVPPSLALKVMLKVLSYDPALSTHGSGDFVIAIPFGANGDAAAALVKACDALEVKTLNERPLKFVAMPVKDLDVKKPHAVLLLDDVADDVRGDALKWSLGAKAYSLALGADEVSNGALLGVGVANGKPQPIINATTAKALNADFKAVLRLARVVQ